MKLLVIIKEYNFIKKNMFKPLEIIQNIQKERLFQILDYAIKNVPYYKQIANQREIFISKDTVFEDIKKFPILTKEKIRRNWNLLHSDLSRIKYEINTSGGTTGEPVKIIQPNDYSLKRYSASLAFNEICGYQAGDKIIKLWGDEKEIIHNTRNILLKFVYKFFKNLTFQNSFKLSIRRIQKYINEINHKKPKIILAYVQSILELAKYIKRNELRIYRMKTIITSAGVLSESVKAYIEEVFDCKVYNRYGSREVSLIAMSCKKSDDLHINMFHQYIEILDKNYLSLNENEKGNIIITNLINYGMPLIRYKIGDMGSINKSKCSCSRNLIKLNNIYGRTVGIFKNEKGDLIDGEYFTHLFYFMENLKKFQVIQEKLNEIAIFLVTINNRPLKQEIEKELKKKIRIVMGSNCEIKINYVNEINVSKSGKLQYVISRVS